MKEKKKQPQFKIFMKNKLVVFSGAILLIFVLLAVRLTVIGRDNGEQYKKQVLSQQEYDSVTIPYQRGAIMDRNGTMLAYSGKVYNIILDSKLMRSNTETLEPTLAALNSCFGLDIGEVRGYITENPDSRYHILLKQLNYDDIQTYIELRDSEESQINPSGIWFEEEYKRQYPYGTLACDAIGFTTKDGIGQYGLEEYYNDILSGSNGREYGYLLDDNALERTIIPAENGDTLVTTIDAYIQGIVEENILVFNQEHANEYREGEMGSDNTGVIIMDIDTGEILAMASFPNYNLNDPYDLTAYYSEQDIATMQEEDTYYSTLQGLWKNFCISESYEPGSVCKTFTVAAALDCGVIHDGDSFYCGGFLQFGEGDHAVTIRCHNRYGEGELTVKQALEQSCNVCLMQIGQKMGQSTFLEYLNNFNFGLKTNIDLTGEMRTSSLVFTEETMGVTELATSTFGQGYNVTMIQTITAFCSLINGGYYYQPHMVSQIVDENGAVVDNIEPVLLRQVVSESVSALMRDYCIGVVQEGTGTYSRPAGYMIGGKTGTAETSGDGKQNYVVSFMGFAPAQDPQIAIYIVIDRPNTAAQDTATRYACLLCRSILTDVLPYLHVFMTEELSEEEEQELLEHGQHVPTVSQNGVSDNAVSGNDVSGNSTSEDCVSQNTTDENGVRTDIVIDPETGYAIDPINGEFLDPVTGIPIDPDSSVLQNATGEDIGFEEQNEEENTESGLNSE